MATTQHIEILFSKLDFGPPKSGLENKLINGMVGCQELFVVVAPSSLCRRRHDSLGGWVGGTSGRHAGPTHSTREKGPKTGYEKDIRLGTKRPNLFLHIPDIGPL